MQSTYMDIRTWAPVVPSVVLSNVIYLMRCYDVRPLLLGIKHQHEVRIPDEGFRSGKGYLVVYISFH